jgi:hypothetical protein
MTKKDSQKLEKKFQEFLAAKGAVKGHYLDFQIQTPYGAVDVGFSHSYRRGGTPCIYCQLRGWPRDVHGFNWFNWRHWKQNFLFTDGYSVDEMLEHAKKHIENFYRDQGKGFPDNI